MAQPSASALSEGQVVSHYAQALSVPESSQPASLVPQPSQTTRAHAFLHPSILSSSLIPAFLIPSSLTTSAPPTLIQATTVTQTAPPTATYTAAAGQNPPPNPNPNPFLLFLIPPTPHPHNPHLNNISHSPFHAPPFSTAPPAAGFSTFPTHLPPPYSFTLATAPAVARPAAPARPSPVSPSLRHQILAGNYVDLAQLIHPSSCYPQFPREVLTSHGPVELKQPLTTHSKVLTAVEFAFTFSLYRDIICSTFPDCRSELDDYMSLIFYLALRFSGHGLYTYHILFAS